jgi:ATP-dependent Lon protease
MMASTGVGNVAILLDGHRPSRHRRCWGTPQNWLLSVLEPSTARRYWDPFLMAECDLSGVSWAMTCNDLTG